MCLVKGERLRSRRLAKGSLARKGGGGDWESCEASTSSRPPTLLVVALLFAYPVGLSGFGHSRFLSQTVAGE